jgi:3',5'-cyclic AMP phosphodiesterase CpdA
MRTIAHISDLHFGRTDPATLQPLADVLQKIHPDLVAVSGDLTQRARIAQFKDAKAFLSSLPSPQIVVPGNHDLPLDNLLLRIFSPLSRFQRYITRDLAPVYVDDEIAVLGLNTTRRMLVKNGRVNAEQVSGINKRFGDLRGGQTRIVVTHHPFDLPAGYDDAQTVRRSRMAMNNFAKAGVDIFLAGHLHVAHAGNTQRHEIAGQTALVIQAGTATSTRGRGELNSFNLIRIQDSEVSVEPYSWQLGHRTFSPSPIKYFRRTAPGPSPEFGLAWQEVRP